MSVILPVNLDFLPADNSMNGTTPAGGIPFDWVNFDKFPDYLIAIKARLNQPDLPFMPSLESLDTLVESLLIGR